MLEVKVLLVSLTFWREESLTQSRRHHEDQTELEEQKEQSWRFHRREQPWHRAFYLEEHHQQKTEYLGQWDRSPGRQRKTRRPWTLGGTFCNGLGHNVRTDRLNRYKNCIQHRS